MASAASVAITMAGMRARVLAATIAALALAACRATPPPAPDDAAVAETHALGRFTEAELAASFAAHASILEGFDAPDAAGGAWRFGDRALYGIRLDDDSGEWANERARVWLVLAEVVSDTAPYGHPIVVDGGEEGLRAVLAPKMSALTFTLPSGEKIERSSDSIVLAVTVFDETGAEIGRSLVAAPATFLGEGFHGTCSRARTWGLPLQENDSEAAHALITVITSFVGFLETFHQSPSLESLRTTIAASTLAKPSIFSAIFGLRLSIDPMITSPIDESRPLPARRDGDGALKFTTTLTLNGTPALALDLVVVEPAPPLRVVGGVIGFEASHPSLPQRKFAARLLAARRGPPKKTAAAPESD